MIFLTHSMQYISGSGYTFAGIDSITTIITNYLGQLVVVMFLFYSGYGVASQIDNRGNSYVKQMPRCRVMKTLLNFDIAVCFFIVLDILLSRKFSISQILLSFVAWDSVGNSNWYIFIILLCYIFTYVACSFFRKKHIGGGIMCLCMASMVGLSFVKEAHWYDTILCYPAGFMYYTYRQTVERWIKRYYLLAIIVLIAVFVCLHDLYTFTYWGLPQNIIAIIFALMVILVTMKVKIGNKWLEWCGVNLFPLYIYQRIPMIALRSTLGEDFVTSCPILYLSISLAITCVIARYYKLWKV